MFGSSPCTLVLTVLASWVIQDCIADLDASTKEATPRPIHIRKTATGEASTLMTAKQRLASKLMAVLST